MWESFPACVCVLVVGGVWLAVAGVLVVVGRLVGLGWRGAWACGIGGYSEKRITAVSVDSRTATLFSAENNAPIFDNSYKRCYNKCNDNNKKAISHQTGYNGLVRRFPSFRV